ncbi:transposase [Paraburkholderia xenovorans]|uniref:transposase n=1 Tax=Paraburkholderia xenovorans TaxID=36873 RepID=UPI0038BA5300
MDILASNPSPAQDLSDEQWRRIVPLLPEMERHAPRRGRPGVDVRFVVDSVLWVLRTGKPWSALPERYAAYQTAHRYYLRWKKSGVLANIVMTLFGTDTMLSRATTPTHQP